MSYRQTRTATLTAGNWRLVPGKTGLCLNHFTSQAAPRPSLDAWCATEKRVEEADKIRKKHPDRIPVPAAIPVPRTTSDPVASPG